jgi:site-specific DNA recombinase
VLENGVLEGLRERLMDPVLFKEFATTFTAEWNKLQGNTAAEQSARTAELQRVRHRIERLVDAITEGTPASAVRDRLQALEQRRLLLEAEAETATAPAPRLHPNLADVYRHKVADLVNAPSQDDAAEAHELVRSLVDHMTLHPEGERHRIEVRGEMATILGLAGSPNAKSPSVSAEALSLQVKMVAGIGFEPMTFRL